MFKNRIETPEYIDLPNCRPDIIEKSHKFMHLVNHYLGGTSAVKQFIKYAHTKNKQNHLNILDIGSGSCDIPLSIVKWAEKKNIKVRFTCIEKDSQALKQKPDFDGLPVSFVNADIFEYQPSAPFDYAIASMFVHHLDNQKIPQLINRLQKYVLNGVFINDLHRTAFTYASCLIISPFLKKEVSHDALISIQKGFQKNQLKELLSFPHRNTTVSLRPWGRITALIEFDGEQKS